jgi:hypothetical protein
MAGDIRESYCHIPQENWERVFWRKERRGNARDNSLTIIMVDEELKGLLELQSAHIPTVDDRKEKHDEDLREDLIRDVCSFEFADRMSVKQSLKGEEL